jgi:hypothetical protein
MTLVKSLHKIIDNPNRIFLSMPGSGILFYSFSKKWICIIHGPWPLSSLAGLRLPANRIRENFGLETIIMRSLEEKLFMKPISHENY